MMDLQEASLRARQEREDRDAGIVKEPDRYVLRRGALYSRSEIETILHYLATRPGDVLADLGAGVGRLSLAVAARVSHVYSLDFSLESLRILAARVASSGTANVSLALADVSRLPLASESCDVAVCCQVLQHVPDPGWRLAALADVYRILRPGGRFVFTVYQWGTIITDAREADFSGRGYRKAFDAGEVQSLLRDAGFHKVNVAGVIHLPHRLSRHLPSFLWPMEVAASRWQGLRGRASYLLGLGVKPERPAAAGTRRANP